MKDEEAGRHHSENRGRSDGTRPEVQSIPRPFLFPRLHPTIPTEQERIERRRAAILKREKQIREGRSRRQPRKAKVSDGEPRLCSCGNECIRYTTKKQRTAYMSMCRECYSEKMRRQNAHRVMADGTRRVNPSGYVMVKHDGQWRLEHTIIMEGKLGRSLRPIETVHHKNGIRHDNRPENLELWLGPVRSGIRAIDWHCPHCGEQWAYED